VFSVGPWEMLLQQSLTMKKVLNSFQNSPQKILRLFSKEFSTFFIESAEFLSKLPTKDLEEF